MKITVVGVGYVGLVTAACLAALGHKVLAFDTSQSKIDQLNSGQIPIYEPGLAEIVSDDLEHPLSFTTDAKEAAKHGTVQIIAVGTPSTEMGAADLSHVYEAVRSIAGYSDGYRLIVIKSTVPVGTAIEVERKVKKILLARGQPLRFDVVSNPEFLREGQSVSDFMNPDRIVVGARSERAFRLMDELYEPLDALICHMTPESSELTKYASNAMLATRISFMNELANLAQKVGADIEEVRVGMSHDPRIGPHFLAAGTGYGGSCFPKDVQALIHQGQRAGVPMHVVQSVAHVNHMQKQVLLNMMLLHFGQDLAALTIAVLGLAFKPDTDDMREAPSLTIIRLLLDSHCKVVLYDPVAQSACKKLFPDAGPVSYAVDARGALHGADSALILTEWEEFKHIDETEFLTLMKIPVVFDGRNIYDPEAMTQAGVTYYSVGRKPAFAANRITDEHDSVRNLAVVAA